MNIKKIFVITKSLFIMYFLTLSSVGVFAQQGDEIYDIVSINGKIVDKRSGKELLVGEIVNFQTDLIFGSLHDRAIVLNSEKTKYYLELPKSSFMNMELTIASTLALAPVQNRSALVNSTIRRGGMLLTEGLSPKTLREYFEIDIFTIVGSSFMVPVQSSDKENFDLMLRYESENKVVDYISTDFSISKNDLKIQGMGIAECFIYLINEKGELLPVTQLSLHFVEKDVILAEFNALLKALNQEKVNNNTTRETLRHYCADVYGVIDRNTLEKLIDEFIAQ